MVGLLDLAPSTKTVPVGGADIGIFGVSAEGIAALLSQFPNLKDVFTGGAAKLDAKAIMAVAPSAIAAIIAAGCGNPGDPKAIGIAAKLPVGDQLKLLSAIIELTMPDGIGPFMEALDSTIARLDIGDRGKAPVTK